MNGPVDMESEAAGRKRELVDVEEALRAMTPARRDLYAANLPLVEAIAVYEVRRLQHRVKPADLMQEGQIGLLKACATFDPEVARRGGRTFAQWAKPLIRWQMRKAARTEARHEKRVLRSAQATAAEHVVYCARAAHPFDDDDEGVRGLAGEAVNGATGAMAACLAGGILRVPGEEGVLLRLEYSLLLAAVAAERARLEPLAQWVLARKYDDEMTWPQMEKIANGRTIAQLRYVHDKAIAALGEALRKRGLETMPPEGMP